MINFRKYGSPPHKAAVLHGGPGSPGYMAPVARELSREIGILEPLQTKDSISRLIDELYSVLNEHAQLPVTLIGHSWGGFLSLIFADEYPELVNKLILVSSGPFEDKYVTLLKETRNSRLSYEEKNEIGKIEKELKRKVSNKNVKLLERLGNLMSRSDSFDPIPANSEVIEYDTEAHNKVWAEAVEMRRKGRFLDIIKKLNLPVMAIHGDYDPHPYEAVKEPFSKYTKDFHFFLLQKCGHYPWLERNARDKFYKMLDSQLK